jgi:hypothetical protein
MLWKTHPLFPWAGGGGFHYHVPLSSRSDLGIHSRLGTPSFTRRRACFVSIIWTFLNIHLHLLVHCQMTKQMEQYLQWCMYMYMYICVCVCVHTCKAGFVKQIISWRLFKLYKQLQVSTANRVNYILQQRHEETHIALGNDRSLLQNYNNITFCSIMQFPTFMVRGLTKLPLRFKELLRKQYLQQIFCKINILCLPFPVAARSKE